MMSRRDWPIHETTGDSSPAYRDFQCSMFTAFMLLSTQLLHPTILTSTYTLKPQVRIK